MEYVKEKLQAHTALSARRVLRVRTLMTDARPEGKREKKKSESKTDTNKRLTT